MVEQSYRTILDGLLLLPRCPESIKPPKRDKWLDVRALEIMHVLSKVAYTLISERFVISDEDLYKILSDVSCEKGRSNRRARMIESIVSTWGAISACFPETQEKISIQGLTALGFLRIFEPNNLMEGLVKLHIIGYMARYDRPSLEIYNRHLANLRSTPAMSPLMRQTYKEIAHWQTS